MRHPLTRSKLVLVTPVLVGLALSGCSRSDQDGHAGHDHAGHDHLGHDHAAHADAPKAKAGPNGGRVIRSLQPHVEVFVTADRRVRITALNADGTAAADTGPLAATLVGGDRAAPTELSFEAANGVLESTAALPAGDDLPTILTLRPSAAATPVIERFRLNMADCSTCAYSEYACTCAH